MTVTSRNSSRKELLESETYEDLQVKLSKILRSIARKKTWLVFWVLFITIISVIYLRITPNTYSSEASIILEPRKQAITTSELLTNTSNNLLDSPLADSQIQVIKSERLLRVVFETLKIGEIDEFKYGNPTLIENLVSFLGFKRSIEKIARLNDRDRLAIAFNNFSSRVSVRRIGQSYVLELSIYSLDPEMAAKLTNAVAMQYIRQQIESKAALSQSGAEYLQGRISRFQEQIDTASSAVKVGVIPTAIFPDADAKIIGAAAVPLGPSSPQRTIIAVFTFILGPVLGIVVVIILGAFDKLINDKHKLHELSDVECIATLTRKHIGRKVINNRFTGFNKHNKTQEESQFFNSQIKETISFIIGTITSEKSHAIGIVNCASGTYSSFLSHIITERMSSSGRDVLLVYNVFGEGNENFVRGFQKVDATIKPPVFGDNISRIDSPKTTTIDFNSYTSNDKDKFYVDDKLLSLMPFHGATQKILIDLPSVKEIGRFRVASNLLAGVIVVVDSKTTKSSDWIAIEEKLGHMNIDILASILIV